MNFYDRITTYIVNGKTIDVRYDYCATMEDEQPKTKEFNFDWSNIDELPYFDRHVYYLFYYDTTFIKKTLYFKAYVRGDNRSEYKYIFGKDALDIKIIVSYRETTEKVSIQRILNYTDADKAIVYLVERGLTVATNR